MAEDSSDLLSNAEQATLVDQLAGNPQQPRSPRAGSETWSVAWSPDGTYFAWSCGGRKVCLVPWNRYKHHIEHNDSLMIEGQTVHSIDTGELVWAIAFGCGTAATTPNSINLNWWRYRVPKDLILATGLHSGKIRTWNVRSGQLLLELLDHKDVIRDLKFAPNGSMSLASVSRDGTLKLWELNDDGNMRKTLRGPSKWIYSCCWSPDAKMMVTTGDSRSALLWDMVKLEKLGKLEGHHNDVCSCDFSPDGALLATASYDTRVVIWDPHTCTKLLELGHMNPPPSPIFAGGANGSYVRGVSFCHDGRHIASVADDGYVRFWDLFNSTVSPVQIAIVNDALCCGYSPDGAALAVGTRNGSVTFWLSPMQVPSLQHICRMAIRRLVPSTTLDSLHLPSRIKSFLKYQDPNVQKVLSPIGSPGSTSS